MSQPFFSILIPSYNRPEYIYKCVNSVLCNDCFDFEILISDDKSPKISAIEQVLNPFADNPKIKIINQPVNLGLAENSNFLVANATGRYSILIGDDDKLLPNTLSTLKKQIESCPDFDLYAIGYSVIDEDDNVYYSCFAPKKLEIGLAYPHLIRLLLYSDVIPFWVFHPFTVCYLTKLRDNVKYVKSALNGIDLLFMYDCMNLSKRMLVVPEVLFLWRKAQKTDKASYENLSTSGINNVEARANILLHMKQRLDLNPTISDIISSNNYRTRFLFDAVTIDKRITDGAIENFKNNNPHIRHLFEGYKIRRNLMANLRIRFGHITSYLRAFGLNGLWYLVNRTLQRNKYNRELLHKSIKLEETNINCELP